jgi:hypothetical protein
MGYWRAGDLELLREISPFIDDVWNTDWRSIVPVIRRRLAEALLDETTRHAQRNLEPAR